MIKNILQILFAAALLVALIFVLIRHAKPRRNRAALIINLLNKLNEKNESGERGICGKRRRR
ncbi:MAG: hypothetical protein WC419_06105 [Candidatus Omnitrophota bacterium]|jgi:hypothetical protein